VLSMTLEVTATDRLARLRKRAAAAAIDLVTVLVLAVGAWWMLRTDPGMTAATVAVAYYAAGTTALGRSAGSRWIEGRPWRPARATPAPPEPADPLFAQWREI
jgi:hypothetical protein